MVSCQMSSQRETLPEPAHTSVVGDDRLFRTVENYQTLEALEHVWLREEGFLPHFFLFAISMLISTKLLFNLG